MAVATPVFDDWASLSRLLADLDNVEADVEFSVFVIDDGSNERAEINLPQAPLRRIRSVEIITLVCNMGHQRAIAIGLVEAGRRENFDALLVMDADGEDRPADIPRLVAKALQHPGCIVYARRGRRPGLLAFRIWYGCYKLAFRLLTGHTLDFGNFCLIPNERVRALINNPSIWNNLASTLRRARLPLVGVPIDRGVRYAGRSKMGFVGLVMHGLSAMAVYSDIVMVRLLLGALAIGAITICGIGWVLFEKLFTTMAIPGWATSAVGILTVVLVQALMLLTIAVFNVMGARSLAVVIPSVDAPKYILARQLVFAAPDETVE